MFDDEDPYPLQEVWIKFASIDREGRFVDECKKQTLPEAPDCTVAELRQRMYDFLCVSPRQPIELHYWGKTLELENGQGEPKTLRGYAIKENSTISVVVRPKPLPASQLPHTGPLRRVRVVTHKLQAPVTLEGVNALTSVAEVKQMLKQHYSKPITYLAPESMPADERSDTMELFKGDQLALEVAGPGGKKNLLKVRRMGPPGSSEEVGIVTDADVIELMHSTNNPEGLTVEKMLIMFQGITLADETTLGDVKLINDDHLFLDFRWPWDKSDEIVEKPAKGDKKGGGKKKK